MTQSCWALKFVGLLLFLSHNSFLLPPYWSRQFFPSPVSSSCELATCPPRQRPCPSAVTHPTQRDGSTSLLAAASCCRRRHLSPVWRSWPSRLDVSLARQPWPPSRSRLGSSPVRALPPCMLCPVRCLPLSHRPPHHRLSSIQRGRTSPSGAWLCPARRSGPARADLSTPPTSLSRGSQPSSSEFVCDGEKTERMTMGPTCHSLL